MLKKGPTAATFELKNKILGSKKNKQEPIAIENPETKEQVKSAKDKKMYHLSIV